MNSDSRAPISYLGVRAAVLGASGFVGRWVARALCARGANVHLVVRDSSAARAVFARYGIRGEIVEMDLRDEAALRRVLESARPAITFNLAGYGVDPAERDEALAYRLNARLVAAVAEMVSDVRDVDWPGQDLLHVGTALEYGTIGGDLSEGSRPRPTTLYGRSKLAGTLCLARRSKALGLKSLTARLFTVYGPDEHPGRLLPSLIEAAKTGEPIALTAGLQCRDFTYVVDVAEGLLRLGLARASPGEVVNLATGRLTPVREFVETAAGHLQIAAHRLEFGRLPTRGWEMEHSEVTIERLKRLTGWSPPAGIDAGIHLAFSFQPSAIDATA